MNIPEYKGEPLSVMSRITQEDAPEHLWHYAYKLTPLPGDLDTINRLTEQGYEQVDGENDVEKGNLIACLVSQLHDVVGVRDGDRANVWAHHKSIEYVKKYPVLLCFTLQDDEHPDTTHIQMLQFLPLPRYGEYAVIGVNDATLYNAHDLDEASQQLKTELGQTILDLAGKSQWGNHTEVHALCASELRYLAVRADLQTDLLTSSGKQRQEIQSNLEKLEKAHREVVNLRQSWLRPDWLHQWQEIRRMAQELAASYYDHHKKKQTQHEATPFLFTPPLPPEKKKRRRPTVISNFDDKGYAIIVGALPMQAVINGVNNAVSGGDKWVFDERTGLPPHFPYEKDAGSTIVSYTDQIDSPVPDARAAQKLWQEVKGFDERTNDIILDIFSHLSKNMEDGAAWFFASSHLDNRGIAPITKADGPGGKRRRAGYRKEDILPINSVLNHLEKIWLTINQFIDEEEVTKRGKTQRRKTQYTHRGRFLVVDQKWYQNEITDEESDIPFPMGGYAIGWHIRPGDWLRTFLETPNYQVARLCKTLLQYDHYHQRWEKRIGRYIMFHGHMQCKGRAGVLTRTISKILDEVSLTPDKSKPNAAARTRNRFEQAMNKLTEDHIINGWKYQKTFKQPYGRKLDAWLEQSIMIYIAPTRELPLTQNDQQKEEKRD